MLHKLKKRLYFVVAAYFAFWAKFVLRRWKPRIIVITGSSGKTTVLHLIEAQLGDKAIYSHQANSAVGIPFHILGLHSNVTSKVGWPWRLFIAPFKALRRTPAAKLYVVEADCDRPHEGEFLSKLLMPEVTLWVSVSNTHSMNFDKLVSSGQFKTHLEAIAHEFGNFIAATTKLVLLNGDQPVMIAEASRIPKGVTSKIFTASAVTEYGLTAQGTSFVINKQMIKLTGLHPKEVGVSLQMINELLSYLKLQLDPNYSKLTLPPGRSAVLAGKNGITLIDSTYNTGLGATEALLKLFDSFPSQHKWLVIGDILEQQHLEQAEHEALAKFLQNIKVEQIVLLGPRVLQYTEPMLVLEHLPVAAFENAGEALEYLQKHLKGGETILFKGARGMEGIIEQLLANSADAAKLVRRGKAWTKRRQAWGLPR